MVDNLVIFGLINPVPALPEAEQRALISAKFEVKEWFVVGKDGDLCDMLKLRRPGRVWAVAYAALLGEQAGGKDNRRDSMVAAKVAIHHKHSKIVECRDEEMPARWSDKDWRAMKRDGEAMCASWAKGRKSVTNGMKGGRKRLVLTPEEKQIAREHWFSTEHATIDDAVAAIKKALGKRAPGRTKLYAFFRSPYTGRGR